MSQPELYKEGPIRLLTRYFEGSVAILVTEPSENSALFWERLM